jgi:hypothetical protein
METPNVQRMEKCQYDKCQLVLMRLIIKIPMIFREINISIELGNCHFLLFSQRLNFVQNKIN